jgi:hypothetical protein
LKKWELAGVTLDPIARSQIHRRLSSIFPTGRDARIHGRQDACRYDGTGRRSSRQGIAKQLN